MKFMVIVKDESIRSGSPTIEGTRITVGDIVDRFYDLGRSSSDIASDLGIEESDVEEALRYYHDNVVDEKRSGIEA